MSTNQKQLFYILYDSITNSVFESQVLAPLIKQKEADPELSITIISFEKDAHLTPPTVDGITFKIGKRGPFLCNLSLWPAARELKRIVAPYAQYEIVARGPFAGYIALKAATKNCTHITVQARGLVAQEYLYTQQITQRQLLVAPIRYLLFHQLEKQVYGTSQQNVTIEAVSDALKEHLVKKYNVDAERITLAHDDLPEPLIKAERLAYRGAIRSQLGIDLSALVFCYNGSYKPWQCPNETIAYFAQELTKDPEAFLLILTPDVDAFKKLCEAELPEHAYHVCSVSQEELPVYVAACDVGLLFRHQHIINWVARPTKLLDYHQAGLTIVHNNTVEAINRIPHLKQVSVPSEQ